MSELAVFRDPMGGRWWVFGRPVEVVSAAGVEEVVPALRTIERTVERRGLVAAGYLSYEAAPAFDPALRVVPPAAGVPLLVFGLFEAPAVHDRPPFEDLRGYSLGSWAASQTEAEYGESIRRIRDHIAGGDTYQVNHTFRLRAAFEGDPRGFFLDLVRAQPDSLAAYLDLGGRVICSASPELFFNLDGDVLTSRPMKGTANRGHDLPSDRARQRWLRGSEKNRAENAMIVDMVRSDLGRVARVGSIGVASRFDVERHPTVFQMTSTVTARTSAPVSEILTAVFPFASVTGAPKVRTMELIRDLENGPRGVYTGAIGTIHPGRRARFSVAIRTAVVDPERGSVEYGVGSGIVWDSVAEDEYSECVTKAGILSRPVPDFDLLETMLWTPVGGYALLDRHLGRLAAAAEYFGRPFDRERILEGLRAVPGPQFRSCCANCGTADLAPTSSFRARVLVASDGSCRIEVAAIGDAPADPVRLGLALDPVQPKDPFLHFKTTHREVHGRARESRPDCEDVLLWNERGEVTESTVANLVVRLDGALVTPPLACGLLDGTFRAELLDRGVITERVIPVNALAHAEALFLVNSVQGWREVEWVD